MTILELLECAPNGIAGVREVILDLAIRGLLVPQTSSEGTADELKARLARARPSDPRRAGRKCLPVADDEIPFKVPPGWCWLRLSDLGEFMGGGTPSKANPAFWSGTIPWVSPKDMKRPYIEDAEDHISQEALGASAAKLIPAPSALFVLRGMILAHSFPVAITRREVAINQDMRALVLSVPAVAPFLLRVLQATRRRVLANVERSSHGTCRLDSGLVENLPVALPPLGEQKRIVAKVDQLMALCDELEAKHKLAGDLLGQTTRAVLGALASVETSEDLERRWGRAAEVFGEIVSTADAAAEVRSTVLELAVRGAMRIARGGSRTGDDVAAEARARLGRRVEPRREAYPLFPLPKGWAWATMGELFEIAGGLQKTPARAPRNHHFPYLRVENVQRGRLDLERVERFELLDGELERLRLRRNDLLIVEGNGSEREIGRCALWGGEIEDCVHQNHIIRCRPLGGVSSEFTLQFLNSPSGKAGMRALAVTTSGLFSLSVGKVRSVAVPVPPPDVAKALVARMRDLTGVCDALEAKIQFRDEKAHGLAAALVAGAVA